MEAATELVVVPGCSRLSLVARGSPTPNYLDYSNRRRWAGGRCALAWQSIDRRRLPLGTKSPAEASNLATGGGGEAQLLRSSPGRRPRVKCST
jgi:hypothetical protein